jgi:hypothetical protein
MCVVVEQSVDGILLWKMGDPPRPIWTTKERTRTAYTWNHPLFDQGQLAGTLEDVARSIGASPVAAAHDEEPNYEGAPANDDAPILNPRVKVIEIVKRNGCYTLEEDGRTREANALTRDEQLIDKDDIRRFKSEDGKRELSSELLRVFENRKGGSSDGWINYTIGRARIFDSESEDPYVSPLLLRVRLEEGELAPSQCKISIRTVMIQGFDPVTRLQTVVDHSTKEVGDVPVSSVSDIAAPGIVIAYPASATLPLQTTLISKRKTRDALDAIRMAYDGVKDGNSKKEVALKSLFPQTNDPALIFVNLVGRLGQRVVRGIGNTASWAINAGLLWESMHRRIEEARSNTQYEYFTYGNAKISVFEDIKRDVESIIQIIESEEKEKTLVASLVDAFRKWWGTNVPEDPNQSDRALYAGFSARQHELFEYIVGRANIRNRANDGDKIVNPGTTLSHFRQASELNQADPSTMFKSTQMQYRIDTYIDIELWDPQFDKQLNITVVPGLQAALDAGRVVQCKGARLQSDFNEMTAAIRRLSLKGNTGRMTRLSPPVWEKNDRNRVVYIEDNNFEGLCASSFRRLLGLPPVLNKSQREVRWESVNVTQWQNEAWNRGDVYIVPLETDDWARLPMFYTNPMLQLLPPLTQLDTPESSSAITNPKNRDIPYLPDDFQRSVAENKRFMTRVIPQLVVPKRIALLTSFDSHIMESVSKTEGMVFNARHTIAAAQLLRRKMDLHSKDVLIFERASGDGRLKFHTVYDLSVGYSGYVSADGSPGERIEALGRELTPVYSSMVRSVVPFSSLYPNSVAMHIGMLFESADDYSTDSLQAVIGGKYDIVDPTVRAEAVEAFAAVLIDVLGTKAVASLSAKDLTESVIQKTNRRIEKAATFLKSVFVQLDAAMVNSDDALLWLASGSATALIALNHSTCWQSQWTSTSSLQGRAVWTRKMDAFATALRSVARSKIKATEIPLLNVQSNWVTGRRLHPTDTLAVKYTVLQTERSLQRILMILNSLTTSTNIPELFQNTAILALQDVVLSRPLVWRVNRDRLLSMLSSEDGDLTAYEDLHSMETRPITYEELVHSWASRRVNIDDLDYDRSVYDVSRQNIDVLSDSLRKCSIVGENCTYYVPVCCDSITDMKASYDPRLAQQTILLKNLERVVGRQLLLSYVKLSEKDTVSANSTINITGAFDNGRPTHPLFLTTTSDNQIYVHIASHTSYLTDVFSVSDPAVFQQYMSLDSITTLLSTLQTVTPDAGMDARCMLLNDARRAVVFAIDRIYQSLLYASSLNYDNPHVVCIDPTRMPTNTDLGGCPPGWPAKAPGRVETVYDTQYPFPDPQTNSESNIRMVLIALHFALALLPTELADRMNFVLISDSDSVVHGGVTDVIASFKRGLISSGFKSVPLGEVAACVIHACF